eukprot:4426758-Alexandrium_andersonii.AAC.1
MSTWLQTSVREGSSKVGQLSGAARACAACSALAASRSVARRRGPACLNVGADPCSEREHCASRSTASGAVYRTPVRR